MHDTALGKLGDLFAPGRRSCRLIAWAGFFLLFSAGIQATGRADELLQILDTGTTASFRACTTLDRIVFLGGTNSTLVRSLDGGQSWVRLAVSDNAELDFRDIECLPDGTLILMSAGPGDKSQLFRSTDRGDQWNQVYVNPHAEGFFNGIAVHPKTGTCAVVGDPLEGRLSLLQSQDHGNNWREISGPAVAEGEYGFAASGTGIRFREDGTLMIATGGARSSVYRANDNGKSWHAAATGLRNGNTSSGIFSLAVRNQRAVVVGGDYLDPQEDGQNVAVSEDAGITWSVCQARMPHKACVRFLDDRTILTCGRTGIMISRDAGSTWQQLSDESYYTFCFDDSKGRVYFAGAEGRSASANIATLLRMSAR